MILLVLDFIVFVIFLCYIFEAFYDAFLVFNKLKFRNKKLFVFNFTCFVITLICMIFNKKAFLTDYHKDK